MLKGWELETGRDVFLGVSSAKGVGLALGVHVLWIAVPLWATCSVHCQSLCHTELRAGPGLNLPYYFMLDRLGRQLQLLRCPIRSWKGTGKTHAMSRQQSKPNPSTEFARKLFP